MFSLSMLISMIFETFFALITDWVFWLIVVLVAFQYYKMAQSSHYLFDLPDNITWRPVLLAASFGIAGGLFGSILLIIVGISVLELGIIYLWMTAAILMLIRQRFLCFAYAGGVLSLANLVFGFPEISVAQLMGLVAILHMVESLLILFSGHLETFPIYIRTKQGRVVGGYNLQKFWPLPIIAMMAIIIPEQEMLRSAVSMPDWWPLIKPGFLQGTGEPLYVLVPVVAALGYGDIAITSRPAEKTRLAAVELTVYSIVLLFLAVAAGHIPQLAVFAALFGPLGHEFIIYLGRRREMKGKPIFVQPERGVMILYVPHHTLFKRAGIRNGDTILTLNGYLVSNSYEIQNILLETNGPLEIEYLSGKKSELKNVRIIRRPDEAIEFVTVPGDYTTRYLEFSDSASLLQRWLVRIKEKISSR